MVVTRGERSPELYGRSLELGVRDFLCKPVLESQVLGAVLEFARQAPAAAKRPSKPEGRRSRRKTEQTMESGDLATHPVPELFARLHRNGASGMLRLRRGEVIRAVQFRNGSSVAVSAPKPRETFEEYVLRTGWIKQEQYDIALEHQLGGLCDPRAALEAMEALSASQAEQAAQEQAREALLELFRWDAGVYEFRPKERIAAAESLALDWDPALALLEGVRSASPAGVVRTALAAHSASCVFAGPDLDSALDLFEAPPEQRAKLAALAGERTLAEEIAAAKLDPRLLYALVLVGAVEIEETVLELTDALNAEPTDRRTSSRRRRSRSPKRGPPRPRRRRRRRRRWLARGAVGARQDTGRLRALRHRSRNEGCRRPARVPRPDRVVSVDPSGPGRPRRTRAIPHRSSLRPRQDQGSAGGLRRPAKGEREGAPGGAARFSRSVEAERHFRKGQERLAAGDPVGAIEALGMAVHLDPDQGDYVAHLGYALYRSKPDSDVIRREALEHIAKGVKLAPDQVTPLFFLGRVFRETGASASAAKVLRKALVLSPDHHEVLQELCLMQMDGPQRKKKGLLGRLRGD